MSKEHYEQRKNAKAIQQGLCLLGRLQKSDVAETYTGFTEPS